MRIKEKGYCKICKEPIKKTYLTRGDDGEYYCTKCLIDLNRKIDFENVLKRRKNELKKQLLEIEIELGENNILDIMYH
mgnify:CR=1 FL=1